MGSFAKHGILSHANLNEVPHLPATTTVPASTRTSRRPAGVSTASFLAPTMLEGRRTPPPAEAESWGTRSFIWEKYFSPGLSPEEAAARIRQTTEGMHDMRHMLDTMSWRFVMFIIRLKSAFFDSDLKNALTTLPENPWRAYAKVANEVADNMSEDRFSACSAHTATMKASMSSSTPRTHLNKIDHNSFGRRATKFHDKRWNTNWSPSKGERRSRRSTTWRMNALPDWPLMAVMVEHVAGSRDWVVNKSVWHLNDEEIKNVYTMYIMFTCWGCCFFASMKDPFYDGESYRKDGGDGSVNWIYEKQEDIEEQARAELWREELIEEIEKKVGGLRELEEAKEEELVK